MGLTDRPASQLDRPDRPPGVPAGAVRSYDGCVPAHLAANNGAAARRPARRGLARRCAGLLFAPSQLAMRRIALAGVLASVGIMLTGAGVRLSQSGLGCPDWPRCTATGFVAGGTTGDPLIHRWIEFSNRLVGVAVFVIAIVVFWAAWRYRPARRRRPDLVWLAGAQPAGIVAQAVIGGVVVLTKLNPVWVSVHFLLSIAVVAAAVALQVRCTEGTGPARPLVRPELRLFGFGVLGVVTVMLAAGTVVTGTGPLAGAESVARYHLSLSAVTQLHADIGWLLGGLAIALALALALTAAPARAVRLGWLLVALLGVQGSIGYAQYFSGLPAGLVWVHVAGSTAIWVNAVWLVFSLRDRGVAAGHRDRMPAAAEPEAAGPEAGPVTAGPVTAGPVTAGPVTAD
jgi:heme a synthase